MSEPPEADPPDDRPDPPASGSSERLMRRLRQDAGGGSDEAPAPAVPSSSERLLKRLRRRDGGTFGALLAGSFLLACLALWGLTWTGQRWFAPPGWMAALVMFLPYLYATALVVGFGLWTVLPDRRSFPVGSTLLLLTAAWLWGPSWPARGTGTGVEPIRVMSWNLRRLWGGPDDGGDTLACVVDTMAEADPDVLTLMEVSQNDIQALEEQAGLSCVHHTYRSDQGPKSGGLATCTRDGWSLGKGSGMRFVDDEDWHYVLTEVEGDGQLFNVLAVHLTPYDYAARRLRSGVEQLAKGDPTPLADLERSSEEVVKGQSDQAAALLQRVQRLRHPTVVAGDFNSSRDAALHTALREHLVDTFEQGGFGFGGTIDVAGWLPLRIDYVYASPRFDVVEARVMASGCSDHRPVVSELVLSSPR